MKALLCCEKKKPMLRIAKEEMKNQNRARCYSKEETKYFTQYIEEEMYEANGKIVAECDFEVEEIKYESLIIDSKIYYYYEPETMFENKFYEKSCLTNEQLKNYLGSNNGYAIHIKNLKIFDKPRFIQDYSKNENPYNYIENAPQNMMYAYDVKSFNESEKKILISIRPQWLCKILNGEKTIEVRKKVLRGMIK